MAPRDLSNYPGPDDPPLANAPDATPETRRQAREWARRVLREADERNTPERQRALREQLGLPARWAIPADDTTPVVFVSQLDTDGASWQPVIDRLTCGAPTITYDRPGLGGRPPRPTPGPAIPYSVLADELAAHLETAGAGRAVVIVGHSVGSLIAREFADRYPQLVAGLMHVDGSMPRFHLDPADYARPVLDGGTIIDTIGGEVEVLHATMPKAPAAVVSRTPGWYDAQLPHPALDQLWTWHQRQLPGARLVAKSAGHDLPREAPALVAYAIDMVMWAARQDVPVTFDRDMLAEAGGEMGYGSSMR